MLIKTLASIFFLMSLVQSFAQTSDECKYFQVITYAKTNAEFNKKLNDQFIFLKLKKRSKKNYVEFNVTPWIQFINISQFKNELNFDSLKLDKKVLEDESEYSKIYNFEAFKSKYLESTIEKNDSRFYLSFSKVVGNFLVAEILNVDNHPKMIRRIGNGVKILFLFDQQGLIKDAFFHIVVYN